MKIRIGISTCPNDTFAFHGLLAGTVDTGDLEFAFELLDIEQLNEGLFAKRFDVAKVSFHAALMASDQVVVLPSGSALGFGVGPLLLASKPESVPQSLEQLTLCPGQHTTASLLMRLFYPDASRIEHTVFSEIMPALQKGDADFGVCIHEGRFTWAEQGLHLVEDLGVRWEKQTGCPLPLGGIVASDNLPSAIINQVQVCIRTSLEQSLASPELALPTMRRYAQEFSDSVLMQHVDLYVNDWTVNLGETGQQAFSQLSSLAQSSRIIPTHQTLRIFS